MLNKRGNDRAVVLNSMGNVDCLQDEAWLVEGGTHQAVGAQDSSPGSTVKNYEVWASILSLVE